MTVTLSGREALVELLRQLATWLEEGQLRAPFSVVPAPHLGANTVRVQADFDLSDLPGAIPDPADDDDADGCR